MMAMQKAQQQKDDVYFNGFCILRLTQYSDHLCAPHDPTDLGYWERFVSDFFAPSGALRQQVYSQRSNSTKQFRIEYPALARFYLTHFMYGVKQIKMCVSGAAEKDIQPTGGRTVFSRNSEITYIYRNDCRVIMTGSLRVNYDSEHRIEYLDIAVTEWCEHIPRASLRQIESPDIKNSPKVQNKKQRSQKIEPTSSLFVPPASMVTEFGIPQGMVQLFEVWHPECVSLDFADKIVLQMAEVLGMMTGVMQYSQAHPALRPQIALENLVAEQQSNARNLANMQATTQNNALSASMMQIQPGGPRTPGLTAQPPSFAASPALQHLGLPGQPNHISHAMPGMGSPHLGGGANHTPSPGHHAGMPGPVAMVHQQSQQGSNSGASANTSPATQKRRRASNVKVEDEGNEAQTNGTGPAGANKVKPSPRIGGKRQKGAA